MVFAFSDDASPHLSRGWAFDGVCGGGSAVFAYLMILFL